MISNKYSKYKICLLIIALVFSSLVQAQSKKQQQLEQKRQEINRQIKQFETLVFQGKKEQKSIISRVEDLNFKISVRQNLIKITNQQANLLTREINNNQKRITILRNKLKLLKEEYAAMVVKSYKSKSEESKVMFLLSSTNFQQAYKRLQYIKQYANYQKKRGEEIKVQTINLQDLNTELLKQKKDKQKLIKDNRVAKRELDKELEQHKILMTSIKKNLSKYTSQIKTRQREANRIDKEIEKIIRDAIASSNKKAGKTNSSSTFALTSEGRALAASFTMNKGKLPWPVKRGAVKLRYGTQRSPIDKNIPIKSNGVRIKTNRGEKVRAVFEGTVIRIGTPKNGNNFILIKHGNYITVYKNLSKIYVKQGDKVKSKQDIGEVLTNRAFGETILQFGIYKDGKTQNPALWIDKM